MAGSCREQRAMPCPASLVGSGHGLTLLIWSMADLHCCCC